MDTVKRFLLLGFLLMLSACGQQEDCCAPDEKKTEEISENEQEESEENVREEAEGSTDSAESTEKSVEVEEVEISLDSVLDEKAGTMHDANDEELEEELTKFIEDHEGEDTPDELVYGKLLEMLGGHPEVQEGIQYFMDFSPELIDLTDQPGGLKYIDGELSLKSNVYILMDNSGSMADEIDGKSKMDAAHESVNQFVSDMPNGTQVSLISYGFNGETSDKDNSCSAVEETFPIGSYEEDEFNEALSKYGSEGNTPLALAIEHVGEVIEASDTTGSHTVYVVSDGQETCNGNPVEAVKDLPGDDNVETVLNIVGFDIADEEVQELIDITEANGGEYLPATNPDELTRVLNKEKLELFVQYREWSNENLQNITQASNEKLQERNEIGHAAMTENRNMMNKMNGVLTRASNESSHKYQFHAARDWVTERNAIVSDFLVENHENSRENVNAEREKLADVVNEEFDKIQEEYEQDIE